VSARDAHALVGATVRAAEDAGRPLDARDLAALANEAGLKNLNAPLDPAASRNATHDANLDRLSEAVERLLPGAVRIWRVSDTTGEGAPSLSESYGRTRPAFYLMRPDGYISVRGRPASDLNALLRHCEAWFARSVTPQQAAG